MRAPALVVGLTILFPAAALAQPPRTGPRNDCGAGALFRKADLPRQALIALRLPMADPNEPFQAGDVIPPGPRLPFRRLICAEPVADGYAVRYERGGRGYGRMMLYLRRRTDGSFVQDAPYGG